MAKTFLKVRAFVKNCPMFVIGNEDNVMVAILVDSELWYYGLYATWERAKEVARGLGNGVVLEVDNGDDD